MKKVLVVEDDERTSRALAIRLEAAGFSVLRAFDAVQATALAMREDPAVVVLDVGLPAGDGFVVAERIRRRPESRDVPLIFTSGRRDDEVRERAANFGAVAFLEKPYAFHELMEALDVTL